MRLEDSPGYARAVRRLAAALLLVAIALAGCASRAADERRARADLIKRLEAAVTAKARMQAAAGEFKGPVLRTRCRPRFGTDPDDLTSPGGRYVCVAVTFVTRLSYTGQEYLATVEWRHATFRFFRYKIPLYYGV
jgi:hypothetical protein